MAVFKQSAALLLQIVYTHTNITYAEELSAFRPVRKSMYGVTNLP
jgi:hypothetical protein